MLVGLAAWPLLAAAQASETALPRPESLPEAALAANRRGDPLVLLVSLPGCAYCEQLRRSWLLPLWREWGNGVVQLDLASDRPVVAFDGAPSTHRAVLRAWGAGFAPTVLWLGPRGRELAQRLVGAGIPDFYGAYFEQGLESARRLLR